MLSKNVYVRADVVVTTTENGQADDVEHDDENFVQRFLKWFDTLQELKATKHSTLCEELRLQMHDKFPDEAAIVDAMKSKVPWTQEQGYVNFYTCPSTSKRGKVHVSFLSMENDAFLGNNIYLADARALFESNPEVLLSKRIEVRPRTKIPLSKQGWEADGALVNGAYTFLCSCIVCFACLENIPIMQPFRRQSQLHTKSMKMHKPDCCRV